MKWWKLRDNKCPKCGDELAKSEEYAGMVECLGISCEFRIGEKRMESIIVSQNRTRLEEDHSDELRDGWNRFDHEAV